MELLNGEEKPRKVAVYIRVSTAEQKIEGYSPEAQRKKLIEYVESNKILNLEYRDEWIFEDAHTGSDLNRKDLNRLRELVRAKKIDAVLVWKIDRLSRSLKHLLGLFEEFEEHKVSFISIQENIDFRGPIGHLIFQIFGAIAQFERELIKGRTHMGRVASAEMGNFTGQAIPYGYKPVPNPEGLKKKGKKLEIIPEEKKIVENIFNWYIYKTLGCGQIAKRLNQLGTLRGQYSRQSSKANPWTAAKIAEMLKNEIYRGVYVANRKTEEGELLPENKWTVVKIPACVRELTFYQAQNARQGKKGGYANQVYLLSGLLRDVSIDPPKSFVGAKRTKGGFSYRRKQFVDKNGTHRQVFEIPGKQLEEYVWSRIEEAMQNPKAFIEHHISAKYTHTSQVQKIEEQLDQLRRNLETVQSLAIPNLFALREKGIISEERFEERLRLKEYEITNLEGQIMKSEDTLKMLSHVEIEVSKLKEASEQVKHHLHRLDREQKQTLCRLFIEGIDLNRRRDGENKKWRITAEIIFRFNPSKFPTTLVEDRTQKPLPNEEKVAKKMKRKDDGGHRRT